VEELMSKMYIVDRFNGERSLDLKNETTLIGRGPGNDIQINDISISRKHAKILRQGEKYFIEDLRSKNGTWINGNAVESGDRVEVQEGVPIAFGNVLVSLGKSFPIDRLPKQYSINLSYSEGEDKKDLSGKDRRVRNRENLELIYKLCLTLMQSLDINEICERLLDSLLYCLKRIDAGYILLLDPKTGKLQEIAARLRNDKGNAEANYSRTIVNRALREKKAIMMPDTSLEDEKNLSDSLETMGVKSLMCVPLISKVGTKGVIYVHSVNVAHGFRKDDLLFLTGLSTPAALAIDNALLHTKSKQAEKELQKAHDDLEIEVHNRTAELVISNNKLEELSRTDGLTGLYNYRHLVERLESEYKRALRYNHDLALLMIDIDHFKETNDSYGHPCGDFMIKNIALLIKNSVRSTDFVARYGGDEIAIILVEANKDIAFEVAQKLRREVEEYAIDWEGRVLKVTVSIGVAATPTEGIENWEELLNASDQALYQAKGVGKNTVTVFRTKEKKN